MITQRSWYSVKVGTLTPEMAVAVWEPGLTKAERKQLKRVQKTALNIIFRKYYESFIHAVDLLDYEMLRHCILV